MYSGSDLDTLMSELSTLTSSGFLQYDFNVGQVNPYLNITVSQAQLNLFPALYRLPQGGPIINLYYTTNFSVPISTFISDMNAGITSTVDGNATILSQINSQLSNWSAFQTTYQSYG